jgi:UDP-N-acetylglucosamine 1-carboxyvinyltransferase
VPDLRAGFSYVIAALVADGVSTITNVGLIRRGYEYFEDKLRALGADLVESPGSGSRALRRRVVSG